METGEDDTSSSGDYRLLQKLKLSYDDKMYQHLHIINGSSFRACNEINNFYKKSNNKFHKIVGQIEKSNII